jgi:hypothetical protein
MPVGHIARVSQIRYRDICNDRRALYLFGDNLAGEGSDERRLGARGEINAVPIPVKRRPGYDARAFFTDKDLADPKVLSALDQAFNRLKRALLAGKDVVVTDEIVSDNFARHAPKFAAFIKSRIGELQALELEALRASPPDQVPQAAS